MNRRTLLMGMVATSATPTFLLAEAVDPLLADPHPQWFVDYLTGCDLVNNASDSWTDEAVEARCGELRDLMQRILRTPASTLAGMAAQIRLFIYMDQEGMEPNPEDWDMLRGIADALAKEGGAT